MEEGETRSQESEGEPTPTSSSHPLRGRLIQFVGQLVSRELVPLELLCERLEAETLEAAGVLSSAAAFNKRQVRINTAMLYRQQKFNLLREESEGFAKVITALYAARKVAANDGALVEIVHQQLVSLIGKPESRITETIMSPCLSPQL